MKLRGLGKIPISIQTRGESFLLSHIYFFAAFVAILAAAIAPIAKKNLYDFAAICGFCFWRRAYEHLIKI